jgi:hypothetical protein
MKTEPTINIQNEVAKIHSQFGMTEIANYQIEKLFEMYVKQSSPKIKQLEWENHGSSITAVGLSDYEYCVNLKDDHTTLSLRNNSQIIVLGTYSRPNEAKSAAQRDFEQRIKECLE